MPPLINVLRFHSMFIFLYSPRQFLFPSHSSSHSLAFLLLVLHGASSMRGSIPSVAPSLVWLSSRHSSLWLFSSGASLLLYGAYALVVLVLFYVVDFLFFVMLVLFSLVLHMVIFLHIFVLFLFANMSWLSLLFCPGILSFTSNYVAWMSSIRFSLAIPFLDGFGRHARYEAIFATFE